MITAIYNQSYLPEGIDDTFPQLIGRLFLLLNLSPQAFNLGRHDNKLNQHRILLFLKVNILRISQPNGFNLFLQERLLSIELINLIAQNMNPPSIILILLNLSQQHLRLSLTLLRLI